MLSKEELRKWKHNPTTEKVLKKLEEKADFFVQDATNGSALNKDPMKMGGYPWTVGVICGAQLILNIEADEEEDEKERGRIKKKVKGS